MLTLLSLSLSLNRLCDLSSTLAELAKLLKRCVLHLKASLGLTTRFTFGCCQNFEGSLWLPYAVPFANQVLSGFTSLCRKCTALHGSWFCLRPLCSCQPFDKRSRCCSNFDGIMAWPTSPALKSAIQLAQTALSPNKVHNNNQAASVT